MEKRISIILMMIFLLVGCQAKTEPINMRAIALIESHFNPLVYNIDTKAAGLYQITPICLDEYNRFNKTNYKQIDLFNPILNYKISDWYFNKRIPQLLKAYKQKISTENILICYNAGIKRLIDNQIPEQTKDFIEKYNKINKGI